jgi:hypothetical protein
VIGRRLLLALTPLGAAAARAETPLEALMRRLAAVRADEVAFAEEKAIPELDLPLAATGTLRWRAPDRLEKRTEWPIREVLRIEGDRLTLERPDQGVRRSLSLDQSPEIRPLVEAIRASLAGDLATLRRHYEIAMEGTPEAFRLTLVPLSTRVLAAVQRIVLAGRDARILEIDTQEGGGTTRLRITPR